MFKDKPKAKAKAKAKTKPKPKTKTNTVISAELRAEKLKSRPPAPKEEQPKGEVVEVKDGFKIDTEAFK